MTTKALIFDCFGVLTVDLWKEFVSTLPDDQVKPARDINHAYDRGEITEFEFLKRVKALTGHKPGQVEAGRNSDGTKNIQLINYIAGLKADYKIGLLSNIASNWIRDVLLTPQEQQLFDEMILSYEVKMTKPDPRIFKLAADRLGVQPNECVLVDDIETYCQAAEAVGMRSVLYQNFDQMKQDLEKLLTPAN